MIFLNDALWLPLLQILAVCRSLLLQWGMELRNSLKNSGARVQSSRSDHQRMDGWMDGWMPELELIERCSIVGPTGLNFIFFLLVVA
jgi:hypothetical protein